MVEKEEKIRSFIIRYIILIVVAIPNLFLFYSVFTPLTIYPVYFLFNIFFDVSLFKNLIFIDPTFTIEIISACVIGSAYYLLLILNLSTPNIRFKKRIKLIFYSFATLLIANILRIFFLGLIYLSNSEFFNITHKILWYFGSVFFVALIWFYQVKKYKIKSKPFYSDLKYLLSQTKQKRKKHSSKKSKKKKSSERKSKKSKNSKRSK